jgi:Flp pilus assembly protein TadD
MKRLGLLLLCTALFGCATASAPSTQPLLHDELFAPPSEPADANGLFELSDAMRHYVHVEIAGQLRVEGAANGLVDALNQHGQLKLDYDTGLTRTAAQAFEARQGNCLSLVIMTAAFARELGLRVMYQNVRGEDTWARSEDIAFLSHHVNLKLSVSNNGYDNDHFLIVDFLPAKYLGTQHTTPISEDTVAAMYLNNRAAEALAQGRIDQAYWWARAAVQRASDFSGAYNTLAVVYERHGDLDAAERVLGQLLEREPDNAQALSNFANLMERLGRADDAITMRAHLSRIEKYPPYYFFQLGTAAFKQGDFRTARSMFEKEVYRADYNSEFHFWLGMANLRLGDVKEAGKELASARDFSTTSRQRDLYAAKLDYLRSLRAQ